MKHSESGFGGMQFLAVACVIAVVAVIATPKYKAYVTKSKVTEAVNLAEHSKRRLNEFYMLNDRFPRSVGEANTAAAKTVTPPKYVREVHVEPSQEGDDVKVMVYLKDGVVENPTGEDQYILLTGVRTDGQYPVEWSCGAQGLDPELLPESCRG